MGAAVNGTGSALRFLFDITLDRPDIVRHLPVARDPRKAPVILSPEEVARMLAAAPGVKYKAALMARPVLEVADIFRDHGPAWRKANAGHVSLGQLKVMSAIESHLADKTAFKAYLAPLHRTKWFVYSKWPFAGPEQVLAYLSRYTHRVAISNSRLIAATGRCAVRLAEAVRRHRGLGCSPDAVRARGRARPCPRAHGA